MVNKKGGETKSHLALFTGALVLEEKSIQGLQNNPSVPPWYPHRKIQKKKKSLQQGIHYSAASGKDGGGGGMTTGRKKVSQHTGAQLRERHKQICST